MVPDDDDDMDGFGRLIEPGGPDKWPVGPAEYCDGWEYPAGREPPYMARTWLGVIVDWSRLPEDGTHGSGKGRPDDDDDEDGSIPALRNDMLPPPPPLVRLSSDEPDS